MPTREHDLQQHAAQVEAWRKELYETVNPNRRTYLQNKLDAAPTVEQHITAYWDALDSKRQQQAEREQAAAAKVQADREAQIRRTLRSRWPGDDTSFEAAYPDLVQQYRVDRALGRAEPEPAHRPKVTI